MRELKLWTYIVVQDGAIWFSPDYEGIEDYEDGYRELYKLICFLPTMRELKCGTPGELVLWVLWFSPDYEGIEELMWTLHS